MTVKARKAANPLLAALHATATDLHKAVRIPRDGGHDSTLMADSVPA